MKQVPLTELIDRLKQQIWHRINNDGSVKDLDGAAFARKLLSDEEKTFARPTIEELVGKNIEDTIKCRGFDWIRIR